MRTACVLPYLILFAGLSIAPSAESRGNTPTKPALRFTATPIKSSFREHEKVVFRFKIENISGSDALVSPAFILDYDIHLEIKSSSGKVVSWCGVLDRQITFGHKFVTLQPGKSLNMSRQISCDDAHDSGYSFPGSGEYSVVAIYQFPVSPKKLRDNPGPVAFASGPYKAESARFTIVTKDP